MMLSSRKSSGGAASSFTPADKKKPHQNFFPSYISRTHVEYELLDSGRGRLS